MLIYLQFSYVPILNMYTENTGEYQLRTFKKVLNIDIF